MDSPACIAVNRFGLGARPGDLVAARRDPRSWLRAQLKGPADVLPGRSGEAIVADAVRSRRAGKAKRRAMRAAGRAVYANEVRGRLLAAVTTERPFVERLVAFWSNHFTVSTARRQVVPVVGAFEREVVRPHVLGRFADLLRAAEEHQAMQVYLDNVRSIGPDSRAGRRTGRGLNENLAREVLELHTLGVDGGYTQADVVALAELLTGWTVGGARDDRPGVVLFSDRRHQPGAKILLGRRYAQGGRAEGSAALDDLAREPATARHVMGKFAGHFVSDAPPRGLVERLAAVFLETDGDLAAVTRALVDSPEPWRGGSGKVKTPWDLVVSTARALPELARRPTRLAGVLAALGQPTWGAPSPAGWSDAAADWVGPESVVRRVGFAGDVAAGVRLDRPVAAFAESVLGPGWAARTAGALASAPADERLALLLASPDFQRR